MQIDQLMEEHFVCPKCRKRQGLADRFSTTGTGFSKFFDIQHKKFLRVSCTYCGYSEIYNLEILEKKDNVRDVLDFIFGG